MKKLILTAFSLLFCLNLKAQNKVFTVENANQFVDAIGPNRTIKLKKAIYISDVSRGKKGKFYKFQQEYDGYGLVISGVSNLKIVGSGNTPVEIITKPAYGDVIAFINCTNITIENVNAGHGPEKGYCTGGVFNISNSKNFIINNSIMYGSGIEGITASNVSGLTCNNSIIKECTYSIMTLNNCKKVTFNNCEFTDNQEFDLVNISDSENVLFQNCNFNNNRTNAEEYSNYSLLNIRTYTPVILKDCTISNNSAIAFRSDPEAVILNNTILQNNSFKRESLAEESEDTPDE